MADGHGRRRRRRRQVTSARRLRPLARRDPGGGVVVRRPRRPRRGRAAVRPAPRSLRHPLRHPRQRRARRGQAQVGARDPAGVRYRTPRRSTRPTSSGRGSASRSARAACLDGLGHDPQNLSGRATTHLADYFRTLADREPGRAPARGPALGRRGDPRPDQRRRRRAARQPDPRGRHDPPDAARDAIPTGARASTSTRCCRCARCRGATRGGCSTRSSSVPTTCPQALSDLVVMASEGNPFYVEELVNWFIEADVIATDSDVWQVLDERLEEAKVPATLRSVLQARLEALPVTERLTLQRASVIGRVFWDDAVESLRRRRRPSVRPSRRARPRRRSTACAAGRSCTSARSRRSTTTASSCSSTPCCATSPTRGCSAAIGATTTASPPAGSRRWPSPRIGRTSTPG